jgi:hypothetical protein
MPGRLGMSRAAVVGLAALAAVNAVLVPLALHESAGTAVDLTAPGTGESATASMAPAPPLRSRPADGPATDPAGVDTAAVLDVTSGLAVYAPAATCGEPMAGLRLSKDDGRTWQTVPVPASSVLRILVADSQRIWLVGTDRECRATVYHTLDGGSTWQAERSTAGTWHRQVDPGSTPRAGRSRPPAPPVGG